LFIGVKSGILPLYAASPVTHSISQAKGGFGLLIHLLSHGGSGKRLLSGSSKASE
jgi:hypothetical protein